MKHSIKMILVILLILVTYGVGTCINLSPYSNITSVPVFAKYKTKNSEIPVLMYHSIAKEKGNGLRVPKEIFREQMQYLKDNNYITLTLDELYSRLESGKKIRDNSVVITFDDGYEDNYKEAYPILKEYGFNATIFVITSFIDKGDIFLKSSELKEMDKNGIDIESHTENHDKLPLLSYKEQMKTMSNSKEYLEDMLSKKVYYIAYPFGQHNKNTLKAAKNAGYKMALTTEGRWAGKKNGIYTLKRIYVNSIFDMDVFKERLANPYFER